MCSVAAKLSAERAFFSHLHQELHKLSVFFSTQEITMVERGKQLKYDADQLLALKQVRPPHIVLFFVNWLTARCKFTVR